MFFGVCVRKKSRSIGRSKSDRQMSVVLKWCFESPQGVSHVRGMRASEASIKAVRWGNIYTHLESDTVLGEIDFSSHAVVTKYVLCHIASRD